MDTVEADPVLCRQAICQLCEGYLLVIDAADHSGPLESDARLALANLRWMCQTSIEESERLPLDKLNRWLGFVQGCLAMRGLIDVDVEREVSRPLFHAAYGGSERAPLPLERGDGPSKSIHPVTDD